MIRKATNKDIKSLTRHLQNKNIDYLTLDHMRNDIANNSMYVLEINNVLIACCSIVETEFAWLGVKRFCIFNKKNNGKGYCEQMLKELTNDNQTYCITPWSDNQPMKHIVEKVGFEYKYTFNKKWLCYLKNA